MATPPPILRTSAPFSSTQHDWETEQEFRIQKEKARVAFEIAKMEQQQKQAAKREREQPALVFLDALLVAWLAAHPREPLSQAVVTELTAQALTAVDAMERHQGLGLDEAGTAVRARFRSEQLEDILPESSIDSSPKERF